MVFLFIEEIVTLRQFFKIINMMPNIRSKNVYEAVMLKQRIAEERKEHQRTENRKFFQESDVRARREKQWTSDKAYNHRYIRSFF